VDQALRPVLAGHERPLILAAAEPLASIFRSVASYPHVADRVIAGSPDDTPDHELAARAREVLDAIYAADIRDLGALYATREAQDRATTDVARAARAATFGAVDTILVDIDQIIAGRIDEQGAVSFPEQQDQGEYGVVDEIAARVLAAGGRVIGVRKADIPREGTLAAILRYPV
jgi:hypothetical protein